MLSNRFLLASGPTRKGRNTSWHGEISQTGHWPLNFSVKCLYFHFEFAEGQNTKIQSKYQNPFQAQNAKISAVSTPILTAKAAFFKAFFKLFQKNQWKTPENLRKFTKPSHQNSEIFKNSEKVDIFWYFRIFTILGVFWNFGVLLVFCTFTVHFEI